MDLTEHRYVNESARGTVSADAGYFSTDNIAEDRDGIDLPIAAGCGDPAARAAAGQCNKVDCFAYDASRDVWLCPADGAGAPLRAAA